MMDLQSYRAAMVDTATYHGYRSPTATPPPARLQEPFRYGVYRFVGPYMVPYRSASRVSDIQAAVARHYGLPLIDMFSQRRGREIARPRQVAMYLCRWLTPRSFPEIGRLFGGRDHTTVIHAVRQITKLRLIDPEMEDAIRAITVAVEAAR